MQRPVDGAQLTQLRHAGLVRVEALLVEPRVAALSRRALARFSPQLSPQQAQAPRQRVHHRLIELSELEHDIVLAAWHGGVHVERRRHERLQEVNQPPVAQRRVLTLHELLA